MIKRIDGDDPVTSWWEKTNEIIDWINKHDQEGRENKVDIDEKGKAIPCLDC